MAEGAEYFTVKEAQKRDKIVMNYFGRAGVKLVVETITQKLMEPPKLPPNAKILDVGAGTGFFTVKIAKAIRAEIPKTGFYAMDMTPAMLMSLAKSSVIVPFLGIAENIKGSIMKVKKQADIPEKFDAIFSTLMLHHSINPEKVFQSLKTVLKKNGKAVVADLCEHSFEEFRTEMGDIHLGFKPENIQKTAQKHFSHVEVEKIAGIRCECSGRAAEIFVATMRNSI